MSAEDDKVGFKKPPRKHQFKKGQSGNPKGRPKVSADLDQILSGELERAISLTWSGETQEVSVREAIVKNLVAEAIKGNLRCLKILFKHLPQGKQIVRFVKKVPGKKLSAIVAGDKPHE
jgi:hypothetical protein